MQFLYNRITGFSTPDTIFLRRQNYFFPKHSISFQNNPKNLDPSYEIELDLEDCLGRVKLIL